MASTLPTPPPAPILLPNPLLEQHQRLERVETQPYDQTTIVGTYGEPEAEYAAIRKRCGLMDCPQRAVIELTGKDRLSFLNNLLTNQTFDKNAKTPMPAGSVVYAFLLNGKGRILCDMNVLDLGDRTLLDIDGRVVPLLMQTFDKYLFGEAVKIRSGIGRLHQLWLYGPESIAALATIGTQIDPATLANMHCQSARVLDREAVIFRDDAVGKLGLGIILPIDIVESVWAALLEKAGQRSDVNFRLLRPIGWAAFNATRIENARPLFGIDFDDTVLPAETGQMDRAVSLTKGCYLGQEIVARMHARGQVARKLVGLKVVGNYLPIAGSRLFDDQQNQIGGITSSTISPVLSSAALCLGYLKKPFYELGTAVTVPAEGQMRQAVVTATPFLSNPDAPGK